MVNLKNITELPVVESAEGLNVIVNDNGAAKQIPANAVGVTSWNGLTDKPFYEEVDTTAVFVEEEFELLYEEPSANVFVAPLPIPVELGSVCDIVMNGVSYNDIVLKTELGLYEGCTLVFAPTDMRMYVPTDVKKLVVSLTVKNTTIKQLDQKFIPDSVKGGVYVVDITATPPSPDYDATPIRDALLRGDTVFIYYDAYYYLVTAFTLGEETNATQSLTVYTAHSRNTLGGLNNNTNSWLFTVHL